ncbi:MAG TPA: FAD/NAD(P)-binding protein [Rhizobiaceae bacterium]|nr:FAD/NAD(P)-binding protein [Rhizobiaceae bacterium]
MLIVEEEMPPQAEEQAHSHQGRAYSATLPDHVLNVNAMHMSAFADEPDDFVLGCAAA